MMFLNNKWLGPFCLAGVAALIAPQASAVSCQDIVYQGAPYTVCHVDPKTEEIRLFLNGENGKPLGNFRAVQQSLEPSERLVFAVNGGMYHKDRSPVGGYVEDGQPLSKINNNKGPGNFHMLPNGVFYIAQDQQEAGLGEAYVVSTDGYLSAMPSVRDMTQSGPMLVIDGQLHPKFVKGSDSLRIRNGVGQCGGGQLAFAISNRAVNFHSFASLFKDHLSCDNALYLDGTISRLYAPDIDRNDLGLAMGPIIGVVVRN